MNLALFLPNWVGDVAMATPAMRALRKHAGQGRIVGVMRPYLADVLAGTTFLDECIPYDPRSPDVRLRGRQVAQCLRANRPDVALLFANSWRTAFLAWRSRARLRVGYARDGRGWLLNQPLRPRRKGFRFVPTPFVDSCLELAYAVGCPTEPPTIELATLPEDEARADAVWNRLGWPRGERVVVLNPGGAYGSAKHWPAEYFADLASRLAAGRKTKVLVLCGHTEQKTAERIAQASGHAGAAALAAGEPGLGLSKACVRRASLLVTTDSGPRFFARAFGVPAVVLFGPTHVAWSDVHDPLEHHVQLAVPCGPCQKRVCPLGHHRCMRELTVDRVMAEIDSTGALCMEAAHAA
jgi:heptosyltransferase-2